MDWMGMRKLVVPQVASLKAVDASGRHPELHVNSIEDQRHRSAEQPDASSAGQISIFFELEQVPRDRLCGSVVRLHIGSASASFRRLPRSSSGFLRPHQYECRLRAAQMTVSGA